MSVTSITGAISALRTISTKQNITMEQAGGTIEDWEQLRTEQQLTRDEKLAAHATYRPMIVEIFNANPTAELDPKEVAQRVGMPCKQGSWTLVRQQLKHLRLTYQGNKVAVADGDMKVAAD